jgi:hypothetical protein
MVFDLAHHRSDIETEGDRLPDACGAGTPGRACDLPIEEYTASLNKMGVPAYVVQHFGGAMLDYQRAHGGRRRAPFDDRRRVC